MNKMPLSNAHHALLSQARNVWLGLSPVVIVHNPLLKAENARLRARITHLEEKLDEEAKRRRRENLANATIAVIDRTDEWSRKTGGYRLVSQMAVSSVEAHVDRTLIAR